MASCVFGAQTQACLYTFARIIIGRDWPIHEISGRLSCPPNRSPGTFTTYTELPQSTQTAGILICRKEDHTRNICCPPSADEYRPSVPVGFDSRHGVVQTSLSCFSSPDPTSRSVLTIRILLANHFRIGIIEPRLRSNLNVTMAVARVLCPYSSGDRPVMTTDGRVML